MCGIFGITEKNPYIISKLISKSSHRGPDGSSIWSNDYLTLGHNLLSITSKPKDGAQPYITKKNNVLTYNGEIFNYNKLLKKFKNDFNSKTTCDTELLGWLLDNFSYKRVICELIDSMHSFVFFNKETNEIVLSRDHVGIKPLYFSEINSGIIFSSEIKGLLDILPNSKKIDRLSLACTCFLGVNVLRQTMFNGIYKVLPGETLIYDLDKKKLKSSFRNLVKPNSNKDFIIEEFYEQSKLAINNSTLGIRNFGMFLSGGLDSSLIAKQLKYNLGSLKSFTTIIEPNINTEEDYNSDAKIAKKFADNIGLDHKEIQITPKTFTANWNESIKFIEEPRYNWCLPMYFYTNKILSENKTIVTMAGDIGDEIFGGYTKYLKMYHLEQKPQSWSDFIAMWMKKFRAPILLNMKFNYDDLHSVLVESLPEEIWNPDDISNSAMALDCITTVSEDFFSRNDRFGMAFSMEGRFPLSSKKFMQYCLDIKSSFKFGSKLSETKYILKKAYESKLPMYILDKPKTGWSAPIMNWLKTDLPLKNKFSKDIARDDGLKNVINDENFFDNSEIGDELSGKRKIISWMLRSWSQEFDMYL